jgi:hypothetical protein
VIRSLTESSIAYRKYTFGGAMMHSLKSFFNYEPGVGFQVFYHIAKMNQKTKM